MFTNKLSGGVVMERNYTEQIREGFFDLIENDTAQIWKNLDRSAGMISSGNWKSHYEQIVSKYRLSSRFAFMRILFEKATGLSPAKADSKALSKGFQVAGIGVFSDITIDHAGRMGSREVEQYKMLLLQSVEEPDCREEAEHLIDRALALPSQGQKGNLSRDEIIRLGHMVHFSLEDMQFILLRVLGDNEAGFRYSSSMDVIDMYGFITNSGLSETEKLKTWYRENAARIKKVDYDDKPADCTQNIADSLEQTFLDWAPENRTDNFKSWLRQNAPFLDIKSKTARKVYMNLAAYAYILSDKTITDMSDMIGNDFYSDMEKISNNRKYHDYTVRLFFRGSKPDARKCDAAASALIYENAEYAGGFRAHDSNSELLYHVPYVENGKVTVRGQLNRNSKTRIHQILMDTAAPTKSDLLYLLWYVANCHWLGISCSAKEKAIFMDEFLAAASCLLEAALLPDFYPPNVLEETLLLSLALGDNDCTPAMVYESICCSFTEKGHARKPVGAKKKSPEQKREMAEYYFAHEAEYPTKTACKKACAAHFGISVSSLEGCCRDYLNGNLPANSTT